MLIKLVEDLAQKDIEVLIKYARRNQTVNRLIALVNSVEHKVKCTNDQNGQIWISAPDIYYIESIDKRTFVYCEKALYRTEFRLYEEGLFRGVFLPALKVRFRFWMANLLQALLFGAWHLVWPLKYYLSGEQSLMGAFMYGLVLLLGTVTFGFIWGYMFEKTNSLWTAIAAHFAANTIQNLLHLQSNSGFDALSSLRGTCASLLGLASIFFIRWITAKYKLPALLSWGRKDDLV
ncbi:MAG TPA: CPBP family intramembrane metalloprotease [Clostridiales bacterium]|nr:CPBP family intramembrane metalloprotease [Clostridiales bacterium]